MDEPSFYACDGCGELCVKRIRCRTCNNIASDRDYEHTIYPDDNPKTVTGMAKPGLHAIPAVALLQLGVAMEEGRRKYGLTNWRDKPVTSSVYLNAAWRHMLAYQDGQDLNPDSIGGSTPHLAHAMACFAIILDAAAQGTLKDDRATAGTAPDLMISMTKES